jgi:hypothetical protein
MSFFLPPIFNPHPGFPKAVRREGKEKGDREKLAKTRRTWIRESSGLFPMKEKLGGGKVFFPLTGFLSSCKTLNIQSPKKFLG